MPFTKKESKQPALSTSAVNLAAKFDDYAISRAALASVWPDSSRKGGVFTVKDIESICAIGERSAYRKVNMDSPWSLPEILALLAESIRRGGSPLLDLISEGCPSAASSSINGRVEDEECEIIGAVDRVRSAFNGKKKVEAKKHLRDLKREVATLEAEVNAL